MGFWCDSTKNYWKMLKQVVNFPHTSQLEADLCLCVCAFVCVYTWIFIDMVSFRCIYGHFVLFKKTAQRVEFGQCNFGIYFHVPVVFASQIDLATAKVKTMYINLWAYQTIWIWATKFSTFHTRRPLYFFSIFRILKPLLFVIFRNKQKQKSQKTIHTKRVCFLLLSHDVIFSTISHLHNSSKRVSPIILLFIIRYSLHFSSINLKEKERKK